MYTAIINSKVVIRFLHEDNGITIITPEGIYHVYYNEISFLTIDLTSRIFFHDKYMVQKTYLLEGHSFFRNTNCLYINSSLYSQFVEFILKRL